MTPSDSSHDEDVEVTKYSIQMTTNEKGFENVTPDDYSASKGVREFCLDANDSFQSPLGQRLNSIMELDEPKSTQMSPLAFCDPNLNELELILNDALKTPFEVRIDPDLLEVHKHKLVFRLQQVINQQVSQQIQTKFQQLMRHSEIEDSLLVSIENKGS